MNKKTNINMNSTKISGWALFKALIRLLGQFALIILGLIQTAMAMVMFTYMDQLKLGYDLNYPFMIITCSISALIFYLVGLVSMLKDANDWNMKQYNNK